MMQYGKSPLGLKLVLSNVRTKLTLIYHRILKELTKETNQMHCIFKHLVKNAESLDKNGVSVIADLGSFYHHQSTNTTKKLVEHELSLPSKYEGMKFKGFCAYHKADFDKRFTEEQKQKLLQHHSKALMIIN